MEFDSGTVRVSDPCYTKDTWCAGTIDNVLPGMWFPFYKAWHEKFECTRDVDPMDFMNDQMDKFEASLAPDLSKEDRKLAWNKFFDERNKRIPGDLPTETFIDYDNRVAELLVVHKNYFLSVDAEADWELTEIDVGVDSGQAGIYEETSYPNVDSLDETWYDTICALTSDKEHGRRKTPVDAQPGPPTYLGGVLPDHSGVVTSTGFGDGGYNCYVLKRDGKVIAIKIVYISDEEEEE